jgi:DNA polymerase-4
LAKTSKTNLRTTLVFILYRTPYAVRHLFIFSSFPCALRRAPCAAFSSMRHIIHIHIPAFAIAVARVSEPRLKDRPVVVVPPQSERSLILSASLEARKEGIYKGMPLGRAVRLCPGLTVLPPNPALTEKASRALSDTASHFTPLWEPFRPGHIYLDVTGTERLWGRAKDTASRIRREVRDRFSLAANLGVSENKMVSSIASRVIRSEGVFDVDHGLEASFMAPFKVDVIPGIGHVRRKILMEELRITLVQELAALDPGGLKILFGREAYVIHQRALGIDPTPVFPAPAKPTVSEEIVLAEDENDNHTLLGVLYTLVERCAKRLRIKAAFPGKAAILIRYSDQMEAKRQVRLPRLSFWDFDLYRPLEDLFFRACTRRVRVRFMRIWFWDFSAPPNQLSLFQIPEPSREKATRMIQALDRIRERYGGTFIQVGKGGLS